MALTIAKLNPNPDRVSGNRTLRYRTVVFDSSYPTGGESLVAADVGLRRILNVTVTAQPINNSGAGDSTKALIARYNHPTAKLQAFWNAASGNPSGEVTDTTDLSTYSCRIEVVGH